MLYCERCGKQIASVGELHQCLESFGQTGNPYSREKLVTGNLITWFVVALLVAGAVLTGSVISMVKSLSPETSSQFDGTADIGTDGATSDLPRDLTSAQIDQGFNYSDDFNTAWRWLTAKEKEKFSCSGIKTCSFVKVIALNNCAKIRGTGHVTLTEDSNAKSVSLASGWLGGSKGQSHLKAGKTGLIELDAAKTFDSSTSTWMSVDNIVCTTY